MACVLPSLNPAGKKGEGLLALCLGANHPARHTVTHMPDQQGGRSRWGLEDDLRREKREDQRGRSREEPPGREDYGMEAH